MVSNTQRLLNVLVKGQNNLIKEQRKLSQSQDGLIKEQRKLSQSQDGFAKVQNNLVEGQNFIRDDIRDLKKRVNEIDTNLTGRINKLGLQLANLEDDSPTIEEFDNLEKRVSVVEQKLVFN